MLDGKFTSLFLAVGQTTLPRTKTLSPFLLRLSQYSVENSLSSSFSGMSVEWVGETGLAGNLWKEDMVRLDFQAESNTLSRPEGRTTTSAHAADQVWVVSLKPMEIKTFIVKIVFV
jgi:hypothetical protein